MAWPNPSDYQEALQNPRRAFADAELQNGTVGLTRLGLPRPISGNFATVFEVTTGPRKWAVRCFSREVSDQQQRYAALHHYLLDRNLPYMAGFEYLPQGILVKGRWYPVVKMEWITGDQLDTFIHKNIRHTAQMQRLAQTWLELSQSLRAVNIAHGDLQHGNIIVTPQGSLKLVDYDGMIIPALAGQKIQEVGHRHYQHPSRTLNIPVTAQNFLSLDNFSTWVIGVSLALVWLDPELWAKTQAGEDNLIFQEADYRRPAQSTTLRLLQAHEDIRVRAIALRFLALINIPSYLQVPPLNGTDAGIVRPTAKEWMGNDRPQERRPQPPTGTGQGWLQDHLPILRPAAPPSRPAGRRVDWLADAVPMPTLPLKVQFPSSLISDEVALYLAEKQNRPAIMKLIFSVRRFVNQRFAGYSVTIQKAEVQAACNEARLDVVAAERDLREALTELDELRASIEARHRQVLQDVDTLTAQINDSYQREKEEIQAAEDRARSSYIHDQLALHELAPGDVQGIGRRRIAVLNGANIWTAADIAPQNEAHAIFVLSGVHGSDPDEDWQLLIEWRRAIESPLRRNAPRPLFEISRIKSHHNTQRQEWMQLRDGRRADLRDMEQQAKSGPQVRRLEAEIRQIQKTISERELRLSQTEEKLALYSEITPEKLVQKIREVLSSLP